MAEPSTPAPPDGPLEAAPGLSTPRVVVTDRALAAVVQANVSMADVPATQRAARARLAALSTHPAAPPLGARLTIWRLPVDDRMDYAPGILVPYAFDPPDGISLAELPAGRAAHLELTGAYAELPKAWGRLFAACEAEGWTCTGLNWEVYGVEGGDGGTTALYALLA